MSPKVAAKQETRTALLQRGMEIMFEKGYTNTGIQEILTSLQVPKGSFYHYFDSKESYAVEIIKHFDETYSANLQNILRNSELTPLQRLREYCTTSMDNMLAQDCRKGCLIGNLSQEMSDQSEVLRKELSIVMRKWRDLFAACIEEGQKTGEIKSSVSPDALAELFLCGWSGAVMRTKTVKQIEPMEIFVNLMIGQLLKT